VSSAIIRIPEKLTSLFRVFPGRKMDRLLVSISGQTVVTKIQPQIQKMIGGGVSAQNKLLIEPLKRRVREHVIPAFAEHLEIRAAALRNSAGLVGAVAWFMQEHSEV
jgi:predicted NBD/HSP70 family sugar kinase